jgi:hypothetical protein
MTHQIDLSPHLEAKLRERAAATGRDAESFIVEAIVEKLDSPKSFREIFSPLQQAFAESPVGDNELAEIVDKAREEHYRRLNASKASAS